jgi:hypothetical protein
MAGLRPGHRRFCARVVMPLRYRFALSACSVAVPEISIV